MTAAADLAAVRWPLDRIGEAAVVLAHGDGLLGDVASPPREPPGDPVILDRWLAATGEQLGVDVEPVTATYRDVERSLAVIAPALVRIDDGVLVVLRAHRGALICLAADGAERRIARRAVARALQAGHEPAQQGRIAELLESTQLAASERQRAEAAMLREFLADTPVMTAWLLRRPAGARFATQLRAAGLGRLATGLVAAHASQYMLLLLAWWTIGRTVLDGHVVPGWLSGWALLLGCSIPLVMLSTWCQGKLAIGIGTLLRRRLLAGALALSPETIHRDGFGRLLGRTIESDSLERLALGGGFASALALLELGFAVPVLAAGAGGGWHAGLLVAWLALTALLGRRVARARGDWTEARMTLTSLTVEHIVGHRTRLAQDLPATWHVGEDAALLRYFDRSAALDRSTLALMVAPRGWLIVGLASLAPVFVAGADAIGLGTSVGGVVLAWLSLTRFGNGVDQLASAHVAWQRTAPLFHAAADPTARRRPASPSYVVARPGQGEAAVLEAPVLEAIDVAFRHPGRDRDVLSGCDVAIRPGDRVLVQGSSGGGKSTLVALLTGMHAPRSGLVLAGGLDMSCLGETGWRARVAAAPQFHENHVLTETFAFNLLMSRSWPPRPGDLEAARAVCEELGLGPLLERMPGGMQQMVGETGWQLSHGEQSRLFIARALLQGSDTIILDESLAALDPETMAIVLRCLRARAPSLVVVAHP